MPRTPLQSIDIPSEDEKIQFQTVAKKDNKTFKPTKMTSSTCRPPAPLPISRNISLSGQRVKKSVPQMVDECDLRKKPKKPVGNLPEVVKEGKSELVHHPADVVLAAITIQRFFRKIKESKESHKKKIKLKKKKRLAEEEDRSETDSDSSAYDTSDEEPNASEDSSSSSDSESQVRRPSSPDSSDTESEQEKLPNTGDSDAEHAALKIQSVFKGFKVRKDLKVKKEQSHVEELPDLNCHDVVNSTIKIQSAFRGFQARKQAQQIKQSQHSFSKVASASITIQKAYRRYRSRKVLEADLPARKQKIVKVRHKSSCSYCHKKG